MTDREKALQEEMIVSFSDSGVARWCSTIPCQARRDLRTARELAGALGLSVGTVSGAGLPVSPAVGTAGMRRMLHRWRRAIDARVATIPSGHAP